MLVALEPFAVTNEPLPVVCYQFRPGRRFPVACYDTSVPGGRAWQAAVGSILVLITAIEVISARQETATYDEGAHLVSGYSYLVTGDYRLMPEHPPLGKLLAALPLLALHPLPPSDNPEWRDDVVMLGAVFVYRNRIDPDTMLFAARSTTVAVALLLGLLLAVWTRRHFGGPASLLTLFLYALDPNVLAHGRYATNDLLAAACYFLACVAWGAYLSSGRRWHLAGAGLALGLALASKFSMLFLVPLFPLLYCVKWWQEAAADAPQRKFSVRGMAGSWAVACLLAAVVVAACYAPEFVRLAEGKGIAGTELTSRIQRSTLAGEALYRVGKTLHLPAFTYLVGVEMTFRHNFLGHPSYLLGEVSQKGGWWYYFPVAFAVKAPTALLLLCLAALGCAARILCRRGVVKRLRQAKFEWFLLAVPMSLFAAYSLMESIDIGLRHVLPAYVLLLPLAGAAVFTVVGHRRAALAAVLGLVAVLHVAEAVKIFPYHLSFFNLPSGGPERGPEYLLDSNIDWGQDIKHLKRWLVAHGNPPVCLRYFGTIDTALYGVPNRGIPTTFETEARARMNCVAAISVTLLHDVYIQRDSYRWLREMRPMGRAGYSIYLYDLRKPAQPPTASEAW